MKNQDLDSFYEKLQETVIQQASRIINHDLFTKSILSTLPVALIATDTNGIIQTSNKASEAITGVNIGAIKDAKAETIFAQSPELVEKIQLAMDTGEKSQFDSLKLVSPTGDENIVNIYIQPVYDEEQAICGTLLALEDQTYISFLKESFKRYMPTADTAPLIAESPGMKRIAGQINALEPSQSPILVTGAPGSGRTFVAAKIHQAASHDADAPFIVIDCRTLLEQTAREFLFGAATTSDADHSLKFKSLHDYGATHLAFGGTLVLGHIEALPSSAQEVLLRYMQAQSDAHQDQHTRLIATTDQDLSRTEGFNTELATALCDSVMAVPSLRKRRKDILPLAEAFLNEETSGKQWTITKEAEDVLLSRRYDTNNASELKEAIHLATLVADGNQILPEHIFTGPKEEDVPFELDLSKIPLINWLTSDKVLTVLRQMVLAFFFTMILACLLIPDSVPGRMINDVIWSLWWPALVILFLFIGRVWCTVCPLSTAATLSRRLLRLNRPPPDWLKKYSPLLIPLGFLVVIWSEHIFHMTIHPVATGILLLALILAAVVITMIFERESWCRYLCPLGNFGAIFSAPAMLGIRPNPSICATRCTTHECTKGSATVEGCPVFHHPLFVRDAHVCKLCFNCVKSCPHQSARLYLRPPLFRIWRQADIGDSVILFALVVFFVSPIMLASRIIPQLGTAAGFTLSVAISFIMALLVRYRLPAFLAKEDDARLTATSRVSLALLLFSWGSFTAFHLSSSSVLHSLSIKTESSNVWSDWIPATGIPMLAILQIGVVLFAASIALISLWRVHKQLLEDDIRSTSWIYPLLFSFGGIYTLLNIILIFKGSLL